jgi:REP element-mobilizing transposase RayT
MAEDVHLLQQSEERPQIMQVLPAYLHKRARALRKGANIVGQLKNEQFQAAAKRFHCAP